MVVLRARPLWARLLRGVAAVVLAWLTWRTGSLAVAAVVTWWVLTTVVLLALPM